jgi:DGQHR domain-containing protein
MMGRPPSYHSGKKHGRLKTGRSFESLSIRQGKHTLYSFAERASRLWSFVSISRREEDKDEGYQRVLSASRVRAVADYILAGNIIPGSITIALDAGKFSATKDRLHIRAGRDVAWVIDGQHRLAGAHLASEEGVEIELNVIALVDFDEQQQIEQFVTINREGKNVPTSLYLDLLKRLPHIKKPGEVAAERAADIANVVRHQKDSIFYGRIAVTTSPHQGRQVSMVNFVRKITPYVNPERGLLNVFTLTQQTEIVENYFVAIRKIYPDEWKKPNSIFFKTIGFGALWNVFEDIFKECTMQGDGFRVQDIEEVMEPLRNFDFAQWSSIGTGSKAEIEAAKNFRIDFARSVEKRRKGGAKKQIRLR